LHDQPNANLNTPPPPAAQATHQPPGIAESIQLLSDAIAIHCPNGDILDAGRCSNEVLHLLHTMAKVAKRLSQL